MVQTGLWGQGCVGTRSSLLQRVQAAQGPWGSLPAGSVAVILLRDRGASLGAWHSLQGNTATGEVHRSSPADLVPKGDPSSGHRRARPASVIPGELLVGARPGAPRAVGVSAMELPGSLRGCVWSVRGRGEIAPPWALGAMR